jgi:hypothetical protein
MKFNEFVNRHAVAVGGAAVLAQLVYLSVFHLAVTAAFREPDRSGRGQKEQAQAPAAADGVTYYEDFSGISATVEGKDAAGVAAALGQPDRVLETRTGKDWCWRYRNDGAARRTSREGKDVRRWRVEDPVSGAGPGCVVVVFLPDGTALYAGGEDDWKTPLPGNPYGRPTASEKRMDEEAAAKAEADARKAARLPKGQGWADIQREKKKQK